MTSRINQDWDICVLSEEQRKYLQYIESKLIVQPIATLSDLQGEYDEETLDRVRGNISTILDAGNYHSRKKPFLNGLSKMYTVLKKREKYRRMQRISAWVKADELSN